MSEKLKENAMEVGHFGYLGVNDANLYSTYHVAISPNGQQVATFNTLTFQLSVCQVNSLTEKRQVKCDSVLNDVDTSAKLAWSLAISNPIEIKDPDSENVYSETLIALSCFDERDMMLGKSLSTSADTSTTKIIYNQTETSSYDTLGNDYDEEKAKDSIRSIKASTWIISIWHEARILTSVDDLGGLVRFLDDDSLRPHSATIIVMNVNGISKTSLNLDNITILKNNSTYNDNSSSWWNKLPFFPQSSLRQDFFFPSKIQAELKKLYQSNPCLELLNRSIENDYFMVEDYKDRVQVVEMYNLRTNKLEMIFHQRSESATTSFGHGSPAVAISRHKSLMAYCRGANSITIYLMENSLEISTQWFPRIERIISLDFINNDETLLIIAHEKDDSSPLIIVWDLFSYMDNAIRVLQDTKKLFTSQYYRLVRSCGNILLVDNDSNGSVLSLLDHPLIKDMLAPASRSKQSLTQLPLHYLHESEWDQAVYHTLFYQDGKHYDAETQDKNFIIVGDKEPWVHSKNYCRISAFLDDEKTTQLFIGETSVQVWYRKDVDSKKELKYIWVSPTNRKLTIKSLEIGQREFKVTLSSRSIQCYREENVVNIHWPFKVNAVNDACSSLRYLYDRRDDPAGPKKQQQYENLVNRTEKIVRQFIKKRPAIWRLIDVRYDVMGNLIYGRRVHLIQQILNGESDFSMKYLHIPRLYEWPKKPKRSDLEIAIKCTEGRRQRDAIMVGFLLDYYSDNAMDNIGWMFTISRTVPLLFDHHLDTYAKDLFSKPIFGAKEIHLDESHINPEDLPRGKLKYIKAFNQNTGLIPKPELSRDFKALQPVMNVIDQSKSKFTQNQQLAALQKVIPKVERGDSSALLALRLVPLPDFTVYPEGTKIQELNIRALPFQLLRILVWPRKYAIRDESKLSPFIRVIRKDRDGTVFDNPAMEAVIDYKWESARRHFIRQAILFATFAILFAVLTGAVKNSFVSYTPGANKDGGKTVINVMIILFYYLGYYLLASEIVQFGYEGWKRYISVYNFFDLASVIMPLATYTVILIRETRDSGIIPPNQLKQLTIATSFTILVLWIETFLLLRYFAVTGNFIYIVINIARNVWPFIAFMGIVVIAHGHAMYLLLRNPEMIGVEPDGSQFQIVNPDGSAVYPGQSIQQTFDLNKATDNYFSNFAQSVTAVYFWINGRWDQLQQWNFWPVTVLSFVASVLLVIVMQNMLIAFMTGVFDEAKSEGRLAVLKYRSELIAEYEILEKPFGSARENPRHIFYIGNINKLSKWLRKCEYYWKLRASSKSKEIFYEHNNYDDDDDDGDCCVSEGGDSKEWDITGLDVDSYEQKNINLMSRRSRIEFYSSWSTDNVNSEKKSSNDGSTKEKKVQFKDLSNDDSTKTTREIISPTIIEGASNIREEIVSLKDSVKTIEGSIDSRLNLLDDKMAEMMNLLNKLATINNLNSSDTS